MNKSDNTPISKKWRSGSSGKKNKALNKLSRKHLKSEDVSRISLASGDIP